MDVEQLLSGQEGSITARLQLSNRMDELVGPLQEVFKDIRQKWKEMQEEPPLWDVVMGFLHAVDWKERWIQGLVAVEVVLLLLALFTRKRSAIQGLVFALSAGVTFMAERLNTLGSRHWQLFSEQNYFDSHGIFFCTMISGPLVLIMFIVLINYLIECVALLIQAKRKELMYKAKQQAKEAKGSKGTALTKKTD